MLTGASPYSRQLVMLTDQSASLQYLELLDSLPDAVVWTRALRDDEHRVVDFRVEYANRKSYENTRGLYVVGVGMTVLGDNMSHPAFTEPSFAELCEVLKNGQTHEHSSFDSTRNEWFFTHRTKLGDGVLSTIRNVPALKSAEQANLHQAQLLDGILDASLNGIIAYETIRDHQGNIIDFSFARFNRAAKKMLNLTDEVIGVSMLAQLDGVKEAGLFDKFVQVVETSEPTQFETPFPAGDGLLWYQMSVVKLNDGLVITFNDITESKQNEQNAEQQARENKRQADLINNVLNNSPSGIKAMEAVRDETGLIIDFVVMVINKAGADVRNREVSEIIGQRALAVFPGLHEAGLFDHYVQVAETNQPRHIEVLYGDTWYDMAIAPFGDGVTVTYTDISESKQAALQIQQQAAENKRQADFLNSVLDSSSNGIIAERAVRNEDGVITDFVIMSVNQRSAEFVQSTAEQLVGRSELELHPRMHQSELFEAYRKTIETGEPQFVEMHHYDGQRDHWANVNTRKLSDDELVITISNVSETKLAQQQIEQTAALLQTVINNSPTALVLYEPILNESGTTVDFRYKLANPVAASATGRSLEYMRNNTLFTMFPMAAQKGFFDRLRVTLETGELQQYEHHFKGDDVDLWAEITLVKQGNDVLAVFQYITDLKRAQKQLEQLTQELQTVIDTSQTGIFLFQPVHNEVGEVIDFRFRIANRQLASYVGQQPEAVIGALGSTWFPDYKTNGLFDSYYKTYATGESLRFDFHYYGSGIDVWLDIMSTKMGDEVLVTFGDYTPLKKLQQQLEASVIDLQRSNKNLEQFAYVASHDLQEPLRKIQAFGDIIRNQYASTIGDEGADIIRRMQSAAARMQVLIKDVLAYSRVATKRESIGLVDLGELMSDVISDLETAINDKKAIVTMQPLPSIPGDASQLRQLFQNLISNALKFSKTSESAECPRIDITSRQVRGGDTDFDIVAADSDRLFNLIDVADNGIGFEPHYAQRIFQVFQRLHSRSEYQGTGIGLAIVQKVVENHRGYITAKGQLGIGSTFSVLLPA
ncbi:PAS domain-containing protein [Spirosoma soli]|uniref:histidine kinase n=1 Tax=Spirosoma soli TaxID=1770529 RepID=A0ABW5M116_9BACT